MILLSGRELSEAQLRNRLARRKYDPPDIDSAVQRLRADTTLDDRRVARAIARRESAIRHRGRSRVLQKLRQLGIDSSIAEDAVSEVFAEVNELDLLEHALGRKLRGKSASDLDERGRARIVRALAAQGFAIESILKRLRS